MSPPLPSSRPRSGLAIRRLAPLLALVVSAARVGAQESGPPPRSLSLQEAIGLAEAGAEQVQIAEAGVTRAQGDQKRALAARLPQLSGSASYSRTLDSQFRGAFSSSDTTGAVECPTFTANPTLPLEARVDSLESAVSCQPGSSGPFGGADFNSLGFGSENTYNLGLTFSWQVFSGGRLAAQSRAADAGRSSADVALASARAELVLDVTQAYYDAQLAQRLVDIAEASLQQAEATLQQTQREQEVGTQAEFEVLRARVARDNQRPAVIQRRTARDLALFRLKQLLDLPLDESLELTDDLEGIPAVSEGAELPARPAVERRAPVRQAQAGVDAQRSQVDVASAQRLPSVALTSSYGRVAFPRDLTPAWSQFRTNWTVGVALQLPLFTGGRIGGDQMAAQASLAEARARLEQAREQASLDTYQAYAELDAARASWQASSGTVEQAQRAYEIAEIRFREGLSTQLELSDSRLLLEQARVNRAQAARDLQVARTRIRLLPDLPLGGGSAGQTGAAASAGGGGSSAASSTGRTTTTTTSGTGASGVVIPGGAGSQGGGNR